MRILRILSYAMSLTAIALASCSRSDSYVEIKKTTMEDKVRGAWAGKMIGVMYGRPMEFQVSDTIFTDSIKWAPENVRASLLEDDIYGQMNFMTTMEEHGQDVSIDTLAKNFAYAKFALCHANLQARKNYLDGIPATELSTPQNSIHCEDIDFQIECDFIGFVNPCMPVASNAMCEKVGAIMAASDGLYAGMYICALHTLAYGSSNIEAIVRQALGAIPQESGYAQCVRDVIACYEADPDNWRAAWDLLHEKYAPYDICTPDFTFNIDAKLNGAYVVMGLLYGKGNWEKTMEITVRCGQDTDCNTATAAAVLGIIDGYDAIPEYLKSYIPQIADEKFNYTDYSYNKAVNQTVAFIEENVVKNGGMIIDSCYVIKSQTPTAPEYVPGFSGLRLGYVQRVGDRSEDWKFYGNWENFCYGDGDYEPYKVATTPGDSLVIAFTGTGIALQGSWNTDGGKAQVYIDNEPVKIVDTYYVTEAGKYLGNRSFLFFTTALEPGSHTLKVVNLEENNPRSSAHKIYVERILAYE